MKNQTATEKRYGMSHAEIERANHEKVCALLKMHGLSSTGLSPDEARMKLAKRIASLVREHFRIR